MAERDSLEARQLRAARDQALMRDVNERIFDLRETSAFGEYVCECALRACTAHVELSVDEYLEIRKQPTRFLVAPGHWSTSLERLVHRTERYEVVEKLGDSARVLVSRAAHDHEGRTDAH